MFARYRNRLIDGLTMFFVTSASLMLLLYVGYGDSKRTYEQILVEAITSNGQLVQNSVEKFLRDGLPLRQYAGFNTIAAPVLGAEGQDVDSLTVYDQSGNQVFAAIDKGNPKLPAPPEAIMRVKRDVIVDYGDTHYQVIFPLSTRFETVGSLVVTSSTAAVSDRLRATFEPLVYLALSLSAIFATLFVFALPHLNRTRVPWPQIGYALTFLIMSVAVILAIIGLYYDGIQGKSRASVATLAERLSDIVEFNLHFKDFEGLPRIFTDFKRLNRDINSAALIENGVVQVDTSSDHVGKGWTSDPRNFEFKTDLTRADRRDRVVNVVATVPRDAVIERVVRSVKNLAALFVASALLAGLFLQVAISLQRIRASEPSETSAAAAKSSAEDVALITIKPIFFLAVFMDALTYSFLPTLMQEAARSAGLSVGYGSMPFTVYYLCFALSLLPAGNFAERHGPKAIIVFGLLLAGASVALMALPLGIVELTVLRGVAGIGQGVLMIGVQSHILAVTSPQKKTQGVAIIVFGFQGGLIAGMALGSLLVSQLHAPGVFKIAGAIGLCTILYTLMRLPSVNASKKVAASMGKAFRQLGTDIAHVITNLDFLKTLFCVGIPAKAILTSTITFALPLLLAQYKFPTEDIGQIIMLYGLAVMAASGFASRLVDRTSNSEQVLFWGTLLSGAGLVLMGLMSPGFFGSGYLGTVLMIIGTVIVGLAHGFINAPVVTHVGQSELGSRIGAIPVTTSYRFLERAGHVAGPIIIAQIFLRFGQDATVLIWIGVGVVILGLLFVLQSLQPQPPLRNQPSEAVR
jgi:MFS family permease